MGYISFANVKTPPIRRRGRRRGFGHDGDAFYKLFPSPEAANMARLLASAGPKLLGHYDLHEKIGEGAMGVVYRGRDRTNGTIVAVKILSAAVAGKESVLRRFEREFEVARRIVHPAVVRALDFGFHEAAPYLVMEFVDGESLGQRVLREGKLSEEVAVPLVFEAALGLAEAHALEIIHRDVKPDNILIAKDGQAKLADLGLAKDHAMDIGLTMTNCGLGTPNYMAPEQFEDAKRATPLCDVYSLGATLYTALTGEVPFRARTPLNTLKKKLRNDFRTPRRLVPTLSARVDQAICRAMSLDPKRRQESCQAFVAELTGQLPQRQQPAEPARAPSRWSERRVHVRFKSAREGDCQPIGGARTHQWSARIHDVSAGGIGLILGRRFEPGTSLVVLLNGNGEGRRSTLLVKVARVVSHSPRRYVIGCIFARKISPGEILALVEAAG